jgi:hypothetical protein
LQFLGQRNLPGAGRIEFGPKDAEDVGRQLNISCLESANTVAAKTTYEVPKFQYDVLSGAMSLALR